MTQRALTSTFLPRPAASPVRHRAQWWLSLGEAVTTVTDVLLGASATPLPPDAFRDDDAHLHRTLRDAEFDRERERLAANRPPLLY
jgi:hypothetical protein